MSIEHDIEVEIVEQTPSTAVNLTELTNAFNSVKMGDIQDHSKLTDKFTLKGMEEISSSVTAAVLKIEEFVNKGKEQSKASSLGSKMLALVDKNNSHIGKWIKSKAVDMKIEALEQQNITEILKIIKNSIESKREEVVSKIVELKQIRDGVIRRLEEYQILDEKVTKIALEAEEYTREKMDSERLSIMIKTSIQKNLMGLKSYIEPLLTSAAISVDTIQAILPTIEEDLLSNLGYASFQEDLQSLHELTKTTQTLTKQVATIINGNVKETIYESISFLKNNGVDIKEYEKLANQEFAHQTKINNLLVDAVKQVSQDFNHMQQVHANLLENTAKSNPLLVEYSEK